MQQAVVHWCEILNYRGKQRERGTAALGMLKQEDGTSDTAGNSAFPHSLSYIYCPLFAKTSDAEVSLGSKSSFLQHLIQKGLISTPLKSLITIFAHKNKPRKKKSEPK